MSSRASPRACDFPVAVILTMRGARGNDLALKLFWEINNALHQKLHHLEFRT